MNTLNDLINICKNKDYILKITYHRCIGWNVKMHKNGRNMPTIDIINEDRDVAFDSAYKGIMKKIE